MAEGGRKPDPFHLTLKLEFSAETTLIQDDVTKLRNYLQGNLPSLQKHFQEDVKYECLHLNKIQKFKKGDFGFELLIYSSDELDQIKALTTERQLDKALSAFSVKHGLHRIAGLDPTQGLAFLCKLEDWRFHEGKLFFSKKPSDSEEDEEEEQQQQQQQQKHQLSKQTGGMAASPDLSVHQEDSNQLGVGERELQLPQEQQQPEADMLEESTEQAIARSTSTKQATTTTQEATTATVEASTGTSIQVPTSTTISTMATTTESIVVTITNTQTASTTYSTLPPMTSSTIVSTTSSKTMIATTSTDSATPPSAAKTDIRTTAFTTMLTATSSSNTDEDDFDKDECHQGDHKCGEYHQASNQQSSGPQLGQERLHGPLHYPQQQLYQEQHSDYTGEQPYHPEQSQHKGQHVHGTVQFSVNSEYEQASSQMSSGQHSCQVQGQSQLHHPQHHYSGQQPHGTEQPKISDTFAYYQPVELCLCHMTKRQLSQQHWLLGST